MKRVLAVLFAAMLVSQAWAIGGLKKMASYMSYVRYEIRPGVRNGYVEIMESSITFPPKSFIYTTAKVEITPILKYKDKEKTFAPYIIQGKKVQEDNPICDYYGGTFRFKNESSIRFEEDMRNSELYVRVKVIKGDKVIVCPDNKVADVIIWPTRLDESVEYTPKIFELRDGNVELEMNIKFPRYYLQDETAKVEMIPILTYKGKEKSFESFTVQGPEAHGNNPQCNYYDGSWFNTKFSIHFEEDMRKSELYVRAKTITGDVEIISPDIKVADFNPPIPKVLFEGIGITFNIANDSVYVTDLYVGSPAEKAGLKQGDCIITVNDETISGVGMTNTAIKGKLDGPKGTKVRLGVVKLGSQKLTPFEITREPIYEEAVTVNYKKQKSIDDYFGETPKQYCDFSAVCSSGQTLYYKIRNSNTVSLCMPMWYPNLVGEFKTYGYCIKPMGNMIIPETVTNGGKTYIVTEINRGAFNGCEELTSVTIPNSINSIGSDAFAGCNNLSSVTIKSEARINNAGIYLKKGKLRYCVLDKSSVSVVSNDKNYSGDIVIPAKITAGNTFSVVGIEGRAFAECIDLKSIAIPNTIKTIGWDAFRSCINLTAIYCQVKSEPYDWDNNWNPNKYKVVWGATDKFKSNSNGGVTTGKSSAQKVYYVVLGSHNTLEDSQKYNSACPDGMECWIYKCTSNGKTVYRVCYACFSTRQKAQAAINEWRSSLYGHLFADAWIWESDGLGNCVYCPINYETEKPKQPLSPK
ncbi:MAG: leucine-rich repeat protein [Salinivirgaceae bacterium]|nr:leucine-rich repeat protein [Salinivirgaceae bacterium]